MKYLIVLSILIMSFSVLAVHAGSTDTKLLTPEQTLHTYINALREGNLEKVLQCYYSEDKNFKFHLPGPMKIDRYEIVKRTTYTAEMTKRYRAIPKAKSGDIEFNVREYLDGKEEMFTYLLRQIDKEWRIISHSGWSQPN